MVVSRSSCASADDPCRTRGAMRPHSMSMHCAAAPAGGPAVEMRMRTTSLSTSDAGQQLQKPRKLWRGGQGRAGLELWRASVVRAGAGLPDERLVLSRRWKRGEGGLGLHLSTVKGTAECKYSVGALHTK